MAKTGRPPGNSNARQLLIDAARTLFTALPFKKVSTRMVAEVAGVNSALIHYYFNDKSGLFETMLLETLAPVREILDAQDMQQAFNPEAFVRAYYRAMAPNPDVPKLIFRIMSDQTDIQHPVIRSILERFFTRGDSMVLDAERLQPRLKPEYRADFSRLTVMGLTVIPFLIPEAILKLHNLNLSEEDFLELAEHNIRVLQQGLLNHENP
tara:strand:- start:29300 stop:29926 length:627 start_codon:yes stop_codon:yes gene_type:complete